MKTITLKNTEPTGFIVRSTTDLDQFSRLESNRKPSESHIDNIVRSMKKHILYAPIYVNDEMAVVDGQHRLGASKKMRDITGMPVSIQYIAFIGENYNEKDVARFNTNTSNWTMKQFIHSHVVRENPSVMLVKKFFELVGKSFSNGNSLYLLTGNSTLDKVKDGTVIITEADYNKAVDIYTCLKDFRDAGVISWRDSRFVKAFYKFFNSGYQHSIMTSVLNESYVKKFLYPRDRQADYFVGLDELYIIALSKEMSHVR